MTAFCAILWRRGNRLLAVLWLGALFAADVVELAGKVSIAKPALYTFQDGALRPLGFHHSFPSGHAARSALLAAALIWSGRVCGHSLARGSSSWSAAQRSMRSTPRLILQVDCSWRRRQSWSCWRPNDIYRVGSCDRAYRRLALARAVAGDERPSGRSPTWRRGHLRSRRS